MLNKLYLLPMPLDCTLHEQCNCLNGLSVSLPNHWSRKASELWLKEALLYFAESCWLVMCTTTIVFSGQASSIGKPHLKWFGRRTINNRIHMTKIGCIANILLKNFGVLTYLYSEIHCYIQAANTHRHTHALSHTHSSANSQDLIRSSFWAIIQLQTIWKWAHWFLTVDFDQKED